jgi:quinohemoprotein ethanol dehydrogenase
MRNGWGLAWSYVVGAGGGNQEGTPLMWNNTLYGITTWSVVYALDARTGKELWRWDPEINQTAVRPKICCGIVNRGLAIHNGMIIAAINDGRLQALDAITGKPVWESRVAYPQDLYTLTMAPRIANGKVIIGASGGDKPTRGFFAAFDAATGHQSWKFYTVPGNPELPPENDAMKAALKTWGGDFWTKGGGGAVWDGFAYDPDSNLVYVGTGNAEPWVQKFRGAQNVDNCTPVRSWRWTSTAASSSGISKPLPNDNWDFDSVQQLMLLDLNINGKQRKVITQASKNGFFWVLDRVTGEFISGAPYVKTNWASGLDAKGRPIVNPEAYYDLEPISLFPTGGGAHNWSPMSLQSRDRLLCTFRCPCRPVHLRWQRAELRPRGKRLSHAARRSQTDRRTGGSGQPTAMGMRGALQAWDPVNQSLSGALTAAEASGGGTCDHGRKPWFSRCLTTGASAR